MTAPVIETNVTTTTVATKMVSGIILLRMIKTNEVNKTTQQASIKFCAASRLIGYQISSLESVLGVRKPYQWFRFIFPKYSGIFKRNKKTETPEQANNAK